MRSDVTADMHVRRANKMREIEREFGEPFWDVVQGFADMGYGKYATAASLEYTQAAFCRLVRDLGQHIRWPDYADLNAWRERVRPDDYAQRISAGRRRSGKRVFWVRVNDREMPASDAARLAGVSTNTIIRRWKSGKRGDALIAPPTPAYLRGLRGATSLHGKRRAA